MTMETDKPLVLILCTGNSCRSHIAEGFLRAAAGDVLNVQSAGGKPAGYVHPLAIKVMQEVGIDISQHRSKHVAEFDGQPFDYVITVCDDANATCPAFPAGTRRLHWSFPDPARVEGTLAERLDAFRRVCDSLRSRLTEFAHAETAS